MALILLVEDSPTQAFVTARLLERRGHRVLVARNGQEGVSLAVREKPQLIIMDIVMPDTNGYQATRAITSNPDTAHIPVIMVSTKGQTTDKLWGLRQGAMGYLTKPLQEAELLATVDHLLQQAQPATA
ncbi:MAG: response regulator [Gammaproteobacteria bacterium]|nr:MAG: response regulator [Gammaproteobacteria bacterium]